MWNPRSDEWDRYFTGDKKHATRDEYRHMLCYGVFIASAHAALTDVRSNNGVDGLLSALDDKRLEVSVYHAAKALAVAQFKGSGSGGSGGGNIRIKEQERAEHADRATKERADNKNKDKRQDQGQASARQPCEEDYYPAGRGA
eukprot:jgi/Tetstr1/438980/TSEL_027472.t1